MRLVLVLASCCLIACSSAGEVGDAGTLDAGTLDAGTLDSGTLDAGTVDASIVLTVDFGAVAFPPLVRKLGVNEVWNEEDPADNNASDDAVRANAGMIAGLLETNRRPDAGTVASSSMSVGPSRLPVFYRAPQVQVRVDENLTSLRQHVTQGTINLIQLAGTPADVFTLDPALLDGGQPNAGNWYPLPLESDFPELGAAFGTFTNAVVADGTPTVWALWQEPDHTISNNLTKVRSVRKFVKLFRQAVFAIRSHDRDALIVGVQQNSSAANGNPSGYQNWVTELLADEASAGTQIPYDFVSIQNYQGENTLSAIESTRVAYAGPRFDLMPTMFNEFDYGKTQTLPDGGPWNPSDAYDSPQGLMQFADLLATFADQPDLDAVLLMRVLYSGAPLATHPVHALLTFGEFRRPVIVSGTGAAQVGALASSEAETLGVLAWNRATTSQVASLILQNLPAALIATQQELIVSTLASTPGATPTIVARVRPAENTVRIEPISVPPQGLVLAQWAPVQLTAPNYGGARFVRHQLWCDRTGTIAAPTGTAHFDVRSGSLVVATKDSSGVGLGSVLLANAPATAGATLHATLETEGLTTASALVVRLEYLSAGSTTKIVEWRDPSAMPSTPWSAVTSWPSAGATVTTQRSGSLLAGASLVFPVAADAPSGWATDDGGRRRVRITVLLTGATTPGVARLRFGQ